VRCRNIWFAAPPPEQASDEDVTAFRAELGGKARERMQQQSAGPAAAAAAEPGDAQVAASASPSLDELVTAAAETETGAPVAPATQPASTAPAEASAIALADIPIPADDAPPLAADADLAGTHFPEREAIENNREDIESVAVRRRAAAETRRRIARRKSRLPVVIAALAVVCAALLAWRKDAVRHMPQLASFYASIGLPVNLRGVTFNDMKIRREVHEGVPVLVVDGTIVNGVSAPVDVPRLRFALRNSAGDEIYTWTAMPTQPILEAGAKLPFRSRLASPPDDGYDVEVRFFTRRDTVAGRH
jgi:hypothetical protein